jgi:hypothetical protein
MDCRISRSGAVLRLAVVVLVAWVGVLISSSVVQATITVTGKTVTANTGATFKKKVATFTSSRAGAKKNDFSATIDWGDGDSSAGTVRKQGPRFGVLGQHKYTVCGSYTITVGITDNVASENGQGTGSAIAAGPGTTPIVTAPVSVVVGATGQTASVPATAGLTYAWLLLDRDDNDLSTFITGGQGTNQLTFNAAPPGTTMFFTVVPAPAAGCTLPAGDRAVQVDFNDVPPSNLFHDFVIDIAGNGITAGCGGGNYCPDAATLRNQMAVFLLKSSDGFDFDPPDPTGLFGDVPVSDPFAPWIEELFHRSVTGGCSVTPPLYCPNDPTLRSQMAVFLLKAKEGSAFTPPAAQGAFADVPVSDPFAPWIEELFRRGITGGCSVSPPLYCPNDPVTRAQMAVFLSRDFGLVFP